MGMACVEVRRIEKVIRRASTKVMPAKILHQIDAGPLAFLGLGVCSLLVLVHGHGKMAALSECGVQNLGPSNSAFSILHS
jgi:hypothetical protein